MSAASARQVESATCACACAAAGALEVKEEAARALCNLSLNSPSTQLAIATGLVALQGLEALVANVGAYRTTGVPGVPTWVCAA